MEKMFNRSEFRRLVSAFAVGLMCMWGENVMAQVVTFYTPRSVRIEKPHGTQAGRESLVVTAKPGNVKVKESVVDGAKVYKSASLTVSVKDGKVTFFDSKGNKITSAIGRSCLIR